MAIEVMRFSSATHEFVFRNHSSALADDEIERTIEKFKEYGLRPVKSHPVPD